MRATNKIFGVILIGVLATSLLEINPIQAQTWQSLNGPLESDITNIIVQGDSIYATSMYMDGFFKKHKDSEQWMFIQVAASDGINEIPLTALTTIEVGPDRTYYAGSIGGAVLTSSDTGSDGYFYVSDDFGQSWKPMDSGLGHCSGGTYPGVNSIIISGKGSLIVDCSNSIFKYSEEKETFIETSESPTLSSNPVFSFYEYQDTLVAGRRTGFEYSTDDGDSWTASAFDSVEVFSFEYMEGTWFAGTKAGLYSSTSITGRFEQVDGLTQLPVHALQRYQSHIIAGTDSGAFRINPDDLAVQAVFQEAITGSVEAVHNIDETILVGTGKGLFECTANSDDCTLTGIPNSQIRTVNIQGKDTLWVGSTTHVYRYFMEIGQWDSSSVPISGSTLSGNIIPLGNHRFHSFGDDYFYTCSMENIQCDSVRVDPGNRIFDVKKNTAGELFLASKKRVFRSTDNGDSWERIYTNPDNINYSLHTFSDSLLFIHGGELIKYSLNTGTYKTLENSVDLITSDGSIYSATCGLQKSIDFGETWTTILRSSDITNADLGGIKFVLSDEQNNKIYGITTHGSVFVTENESDWGIIEETQLHLKYMKSAAIGADGTLYLGTDNAGVFTNTQPLNPPITISNEEELKSSIPKKFTLKQNYPNPFNPSTTIPFELNQNAEVSISLYNVFGQKVNEYNLGRKRAGAHQHQIDMNQQASGVYFLRVNAGEHSEVIRISFIK